MSATHATFDIVRTFTAPPARVFAAWADAEQKQHWFACHDDWQSVNYKLNFQVGGQETNTVLVPGHDAHHYLATYLDILPDARIVYAYDLRMGDKRISVSLATVVFARRGAGTEMKFTEQVVFLDGYQDNGERKRGTEEQFKRLSVR